MSSVRCLLAFMASFLIGAVAQSASAAGHRPPAVPLVIATVFQHLVPGGQADGCRHVH
jgi:hypothetical protein